MLREDQIPRFSPRIGFEPRENDPSQILMPYLLHSCLFRVVAAVVVNLTRSVKLIRNRLKLEIKEFGYDWRLWLFTTACPDQRVDGI